MLDIDAEIPIFKYDSTNFYFNVNEGHSGDSALDLIIREKWQQAEKDGTFCYTLNIRDWQILKGRYGFLAQLNPDRASKRRKPEDIVKMSQSFDPNRFNFTKISKREILFDIGNGDANDVIAVNVSPIEWGHCLLLTKRFQCLPQIITRYSLRKAVDLMLLSNSPHLRIIFNSLCAHASVNHLHWHMYYLRHQMPLEHLSLQELRNPVFVLTDFPAKGFCLKLSSFPTRDTDNLLLWTDAITSYMQEHEIAHNVYITRAKTSCRTKEYDDIRVYIWARAPSIGVKDTTSFIPAVCELFGHLPIRCEDEYRGISEEKISKVLNHITADTFNGVKEEIKSLVDEKRQCLEV